MKKHTITKEGINESYLKYVNAKENEEAAIYYVEIFSDCNLKCNMCPFGCRNLFHREHGMMDEQKFTEIIDKIARVSPHATVHTYHHCEPMLHPSLPEFIRIVKQHGLKCAISTNFNIINGLKEIIEAGVDEIIVSVSGFYQETYEKSHVGGNIEVVKNNLKELKKILEQTGNKVKVEISYHMYMDNIGIDYKNMQKFVCELGYTFLPIWSRSINAEMDMKYLREKGFSRCYASDNWLGEGRLPVAFYDTMERMVHRPEFFLRGKWQDIEGSSCPCDKRIINIHWDGKIEACNWGFDDRLNMYGDYRDVDIDSFYERRKQSSFCQECLKNNVAFYLNYDDLKNVESTAYEILKNRLKEEEACPEVFGKNIDEIEIFCGKYENIYIYGAGKSGKNLMNLLEVESVKNLKGFVVSDALTGGTQKSEDTVIGIEELKKCGNKNIGIIIAMKRQFKAEISEKVSEIPFDVIYAAEHLLY